MLGGGFGFDVDDAVGGVGVDGGLLGAEAVDTDAGRDLDVGLPSTVTLQREGVRRGAGEVEREPFEPGLVDVRDRVAGRVPRRRPGPQLGRTGRRGADLAAAQHDRS